jgi:hypothetical protein
MRVRLVIGHDGEASNSIRRIEMRSRSWVAALVVSAVVIVGCSSNEADGASFADDSVNLGMTGVSPHVERVGAVDRVWRSDGPQGTAVSDCTDAGTCTAVSANWGSPINDFTAVTFGGKRRAYFKKMDPNSGTQGVYTAECANAECTSIGAATLTSSQMQVPTTMKAWGVPDAVVLPDGSGVRIYIVESPSMNSSCPEKVAAYRSADGISFTKESGSVFSKDGFVDTEILRAKTGDWVMIMADGPGCGPAQKLYVATSADGLNWSMPQTLTSSDRSRLDPTGYEIAPNQFRVYFAASGGRADMNFQIARGTLSLTASSKATTATSKGVKAGATCSKAGLKAKSGKTSLTCKKVKGKLTWSR